MARMTQEEREAFVENAEKRFTERLERITNDPAEWRTWVEELARFGAHYSVGNQWLLILQCADRGVKPQYFMPYGGKDGRSGWKGVKRQVRKNEDAFRIWAPIRKRPTEQQAQQREAAGLKVRRDPDTGRPAIQVVGYALSATFDLSQTDPMEGHEDRVFTVPTVEVLRRQKLHGGRKAELLDGEDPTGAYADVVKLIQDEGYTYELCPPDDQRLGKANARTHYGQRWVLVRDDVAGAQRVKTTVHELAHIRCDHEPGLRAGVDLHRGQRETEAESVAHIVCLALGLDTQAFTDAYVLGWADGNLDLIKQAMQTVQRVAKQILADLTPELLDDEHDSGDDSERDAMTGALETRAQEEAAA